MLQAFRDNTQSIIVKIIVGFIIVTFALFGVDSLIGLAGKADAPISVNGADISERQLQDAIDLQRRQLMAQMGENADPSLLDDAMIRGAVIDNLVEREVLRQAAVDQNMAISEQILDNSILTTPEFQTEGRFDRNRFESVLRNVGMTPLSYRDYLRNEMLLGQDRTGFIASAFALPSEVNQVTSLDRQTRDIYVAEFPLGDLSAVAVSDQEVEQRYQDNQASFLSDEQVALNYVELNKQDLAAGLDVNEAELQTQYQQLLDGFSADEARDAAHILVTIDDNRSEEEAKKRIQEVADKLAAGADFAELAKQYSDDPGSAEEGGDLGLVEKGTMVPEFEQALFAMDEGQISEPVRTDFGYHLIKLNTIDVQAPPTFEQERERLANEQRLQQAEVLFVKKSEELDDLRFSSTDLIDASEIMGLPIQETGFFGRNGGDTEISKNPRVLKAAFSDEVLKLGENSALIELNRDRILVVHLKEHRPVRTLELTEVHDQIKAQMAQEKLQQQRKDEAKSLAESATATSLTEAEQWQLITAVGRADQRVGPEVLGELFKMGKPAEGQVVTKVIELQSGGVAVVALTKVIDNPQVLSDEQKHSLAAFLASRKGQLNFQNHVAYLKSIAEVVKN